MDAAVAAAFYTGAFTLIVWLGTSIWKNVTIQRTNLYKLRVRTLQQKIERFYAPIYSLVWQIFNANELQNKIRKQGQLTPEQLRQVERYFAHAIFIPLHQQINDILKTKMYLVDGVEVPKSFYDYMLHSRQERIQIELSENVGIDTSFVEGKRWPPQFYEDVENSLKRLMKEYEKAAQHLR